MPRQPRSRWRAAARGGLAPAGAGRHVPRQQVFVGRVHVDRVRRAPAVVEQRIPVARLAARSASSRRKAALPSISGWSTGRAGRRAEHAPQVVRDAATAQHQHAFGCKRGERRAERELLRRALAGHEGKWQHRNVGTGVEVAQRGPVAVVQPPFGQRCAPSMPARSAARRPARPALARPVRRSAACRASDRNRRSRRPLHAAHRPAAPASRAVRVRRDRDDRPRPAERGIDGRPEPLHEGARRAGLERDHR